MAYELPELPYAYDGLEPHIDARTMEIHHSKHHAGYVAKVNAALKTWTTAKAKCAGNYEYTVSFSSAFGFGHTTTIVVKNNKVVERRYEAFNRRQPPVPGAKPNAWVETILARLQPGNRRILRSFGSMNFAIAAMTIRWRRSCCAALPEPIAS